MNTTPTNKDLTSMPTSLENLLQSIQAIRTPFVLGIIGGSGVGKTTLLNLIREHLDPEQSKSKLIEADKVRHLSQPFLLKLESAKMLFIDDHEFLEYNITGLNSEPAITIYTSTVKIKHNTFPNILDYPMPNTTHMLTFSDSNFHVYHLRSIYTKEAKTKQIAQTAALHYESLSNEPYGFVCFSKIDDNPSLEKYLFRIKNNQ
jgi:ABC-type dipeptide/oligopeptide/nickel transport system ATPase subunit